MELEEKLKVSDGMGTWIDDFKKSDAPQFKGKNEKERRDMAIAAYLSAKKGDKNEKWVPYYDYKTKTRKMKQVPSAPWEKESVDEGYVSHAQRKAVWATRADDGKGHPDKSKKEGLWDNIHAKRKRGEKMRKKGEKGAPTDAAIKSAQEKVDFSLPKVKPVKSKVDLKTMKKVKDFYKKPMKPTAETNIEEGAYVGGPPHTYSQYIGGINSKTANSIKKHLDKKGHKYDDWSHVDRNKKADTHYISMKSKEGHAELQKAKAAHKIDKGEERRKNIAHGKKFNESVPYRKGTHDSGDDAGNAPGQTVYNYKTKKVEFQPYKKTKKESVDEVNMKSEGEVPFKGSYTKNAKPMTFKQMRKTVKKLAQKGQSGMKSEKLTPDQARQKISSPTSIPPHIIKKMRDAAKKAGR